MPPSERCWPRLGTPSPGSSAPINIRRSGGGVFCAAAPHLLLFLGRLQIRSLSPNQYSALRWGLPCATAAALAAAST